MRSLMKDVDSKKNWAKLVDELLKTFVRPKLIQPTFIYDYPVSMSPLAKNKAGEERVVERFQPYIGGMELGNAYSELNDPILQRERFTEQMQERHGSDEEKWTIDEVEELVPKFLLLNYVNPAPPAPPAQEKK